MLIHSIAQRPEHPIQNPRPLRRVRASVGERIAAGIVAGVILAVMIIAARLVPSPDGVGTHRGLGLPPCGMLAATGIPCPTCGMTTSFAHMAHLSPLAAFKAQPMAAVACVAACGAMWWCLHIAVFASRLGSLAARMLTTRVVWVFFGLGAAAWVYKIVTMQ